MSELTEGMKACKRAGEQRAYRRGIKCERARHAALVEAVEAHLKTIGMSEAAHVFCETLNGISFALTGLKESEAGNE